MSDEKNNKRFNMAISEELIRDIDNYRKATGQFPPPSRAEVVRELLKFALKHAPDDLLHLD